MLDHNHAGYNLKNISKTKTKQKQPESFSKCNNFRFRPSEKTDLCNSWLLSTVSLESAGMGGKVILFDSLIRIRSIAQSEKLTLSSSTLLFHKLLPCVQTAAWIVQRCLFFPLCPVWLSILSKRWSRLQLLVSMSLINVCIFPSFMLSLH